MQELLNERQTQYGNFHTFANLSQTLNNIILQHYANTHVNSEGKVQPMPEFVMEAIHMICHKLSRIANGNPYHLDSWQDIAGYALLPVQIIEGAQKAAMEQQAQAEAAAAAEEKEEEPKETEEV